MIDWCKPSLSKGRALFLHYSSNNHIKGPWFLFFMVNIIVSVYNYIYCRLYEHQWCDPNWGCCVNGTVDCLHCCAKITLEEYEERFQ